MLDLMYVRFQQYYIAHNSLATNEKQHNMSWADKEKSSKFLNVVT